MILKAENLNSINTLEHIIKDSFDEEIYQNDIHSLIDNSSSLVALLLGQSRLYYDYSIDPIFHDEIEAMILGEYKVIKMKKRDAKAHNSGNQNTEYAKFLHNNLNFLNNKRLKKKI